MMKVEITGWVNNVKDGQYGQSFTLAYTHREKRDGQWVNGLKEYFTVRLQQGESAPPENTIVVVTGKLVKKQGEKQVFQDIYAESWTPSEASFSKNGAGAKTAPTAAPLHKKRSVKNTDVPF